MRTLFLTILLVFSSKIFAQTIPNQNFDSLCICAIDRVWQWVTSDFVQISNDTVQPFMPNHLYENLTTELHFAIQSVQINYNDTDTARQMKSIKLITQPDIKYKNGAPFRGFVINGEQFYTNSAGEIDLIRGGTPFTHRPAYINGFYKLENTASAALDYGKVIAVLKRYNTTSKSYDTIAIAESNLGLSETQVWTLFQVPFVYQSTDSPDSIVVAIYSATTGIAATTLWIDDISFSVADGVNELNIPNPSFFYPNPATYVIRFSNGKNTSRKYAVFSIRGAVLMQGEMTNELNISDLNPGIYFIKLEEGDKFDFYKIIKI